MPLIYLALGSNLKNAQRQLRLALRSLKHLEQSQMITVASFYSNKAQGRKGQPHFCNTVVSLHTRLSPNALLLACQRIENSQGRVRRVRWGARVIDIDILLYGDQVIQRPDLIIPHPRMAERDFVQIPLMEISVPSRPPAWP
jgi:2-amino-4-hydroxy-6-hydroxymethyldihydropteridine diphosphokinase